MNEKKRTISIETYDAEGAGVSRHYNVDNIVYFQVIDADNTPLVYALTFGIPIIVVISLLSIGWLPAILTGLVTMIVLAVLFAEPDKAEVSTLTDTHELSESNQVQEFERELRTKSQGCLSVKGSDGDEFKEYEYRYYFIPDNIVSIERKPGMTMLMYILLFGFLLLSMLLPMWQFSEGNVIGGILLGFVWIGLVFVISKWNPDDGVAFKLQNDVEKHFKMAPSDADKLIHQFQQRL